MKVKEKTMKIDNMKAGRELDGKVMSEVFGYPVSWWSLHPNKRKVGDYRIATFGFEYLWPDAEGDMPVLEMLVDGEWVAVPMVSTDIAAAWQVVEKFAHTSRNKVGLELGFSNFRLTAYPVRGWNCHLGIDGKDGVSANADTAPLAICLAALKAIE